MRVAVIGGGAAGFFYAINCKLNHADAQVTIYEAGSRVLRKVKVSGGGRCNVTHACFDPSELVKHYPRGNRELLSVFHRFQPQNTVEWFEERGVNLKIEEDGRMFPVTDDSQTIIDCFWQQMKVLGVKLQTGMELTNLKRDSNNWLLQFRNHEPVVCDVVVIASGSNSKVWKLLSGIGHRIVSPVPSLFTFNVQSDLLKGLEGISVENATVKCAAASLETKGPLLVTHWGMSGPAVLRLSAWGARVLNENGYKFTLTVNFVSKERAVVQAFFEAHKTQHAKRKVWSHALLELPLRLWQRLVAAAKISSEKNWGDVSKTELLQLTENICALHLIVNGKSTFKDEFVTAGGVELREVNFKTMESKNHPRLFFAGEVLNIDGVTGGFNFQSAWSTAWLAAQSL